MTPKIHAITGTNCFPSLYHLMMHCKSHLCSAELALKEKSLVVGLPRTPFNSMLPHGHTEKVAIIGGRYHVIQYTQHENELP